MTSGYETKTVSEQVYAIYEHIALDPVTTRSVVFEVTFDSDYSTICIEEAECSRCSELDTAVCDNFYEDKMSVLSEETFYEAKSWPYDTRFEYRCGPGRGFVDPDGVTIHQTQEMRCNWTADWEPTSALMSCKCEILCP